MSTSERDKWNERYRSGAYKARPWPTPLLAEWLPQLPRGRALDVACGAGRNSLFLAEHGYDVDAVDVSSVALERARASAEERGLTINCVEMDLESAFPSGGPYDLIIMVRYTHPTLLPRLIDLLGDGGCLLCEEHFRTQHDVIGPTNPAYRVEPNELLKLASGLRVIFYRESLLDDPDGRRAALAQLIACRGSAAL